MPNVHLNDIFKNIANLHEKNNSCEYTFNKMPLENCVTEAVV